MKKRIVFTGGGTGGHVYPALAVIDKLESSAAEILWLGSGKGMEKKIVDQRKIPFYSIPCGKMRRYFSLLNFIDIFKIIGGFFCSLFIFIKLKPDLIFSKGGFVTVPPVAAACLLRIPVFTHDSDIGPGLATKINALWADRILVSSEESRNYFSRSKQERIFVTGNPVREELLRGDSEKGRRMLGIKEDIPVILIMGGSLGAEQINNLILSNLGKLTEKYFIIHQTGEKNFKNLKQNNYYSVPYFNDELSDIFKIATLVISRSGASAVWEFAAAGLPSIYIPLESGSRGEQVKNAEVFQHLGSASVLRGDISSETFVDAIEKILDNKDNLKKMTEAAGEISNLESSSVISDMIKEVIA